MLPGTVVQSPSLEMDKKRPVQFCVTESSRMDASPSEAGWVTFGCDACSPDSGSNPHQATFAPTTSVPGVFFLEWVSVNWVFFQVLHSPDPKEEKPNLVEYFSAGREETRVPILIDPLCILSKLLDVSGPHTLYSYNEQLDHDDHSSL